ncbi:PIG-L deacetylase family protein [Pseudoalteromonas piscicida]|uniref:PIG-L family deacetylase n=1 Tax=Pseudoalteromonas piscicida TaxID=43662 RepID=A0AAD0RGF7_PSEO7|nr:PIG-L deacetylase family protein [Pseudoalteromonas piscicida]ASD68093.1 PIG-L domain-containing protein [Pseudoalteromonas piscicida]AXR01198.1 PIG-L family deacetylase [Pseudoalteromonas piscicida]
MKNVLVVAPHADDEILGCGGAIVKHLEAGEQVFIAIMTNAALGAPEMFDVAAIEKTRAEAKRSHELLGVTETIFYDFPAPQLEQYPQYKIASALNQLIKEKQIDTLYIPHKGDLHLDHGAIYNACLVAARPVPGQCVKHIYSYETLSETEWGHPTTEAVFIPRKFVALSEHHFEKKLAAMECFASQLKEFPNTRSLEAIRNLAAVRGATIGTHYAESFDIIRSIAD